MKKYIFISLGSILSSIVLIIILYKNTDIPILDELVESTTKAIGIKPAMVLEKETRREETEKANSITTQMPDLSDNVDEQKRQLAERQKQFDDSVALVKHINDSIQVAVSAKEKEKEAKRKNLFNAQIDEQLVAKLAAEKELKDKLIADSIAKAAKPKKKLFNAQVDEKVKANNNSANAGLTFFEAKVHGSQKFIDNGMVEFRLAKPYKLEGKDLPENLVFKTKVNVFDGKVHFVLNSIDKLTNIKGENYDQGKEGKVISKEMLLGADSYLISDGQLMTFGVKSNN